ncbi:MAG TPA: GYD domain-containing protein [Gaiellaceae bacterium]|nr:GYD domain-containing protein [Gaiellaceae bacterium]
MPIYITLMKFTSQGMSGIPAWRDRVEEAERAIQARGGRLIDAYVTLGRYDVVEVFEAPNDETAYQILIEVARHGQVTTETLRAFTREEAERIVKES